MPSPPLPGMLGFEIANEGVLNLVEADLARVAFHLRSHGRLRRLHERLRDEVVIPSISHNFTAGGRPRWEPIQEESFLRRRSAGRTRKKPGRKYRSRSKQRSDFIEKGLAGGATPLVDTGGLWRSATRKARFYIRDNKMYYGSWPQKYFFAPYHNVGGSIIPQRQFLDFFRHSEEVDDLARITGEWIEEIVRKDTRPVYV